MCYSCLYIAWMTPTDDREIKCENVLNLAWRGFEDLLFQKLDSTFKTKENSCGQNFINC